ncbi:SpoIID/LytB domain-containing protein [Nocardioides dubius]|uniref:Sporulation stage II protein D amidase enhancer LytB N-terminal domain-containing protein n=1 Tax=Nocardioides dubius TaxID=317019 RepID=A0ABN1TM09_9ACTN
MLTTSARLATLFALVVSTVLVAAPSGAAEENQNFTVPQNGRLVIHGHGYGHGHGMSQYGAEGAARQGLSWKQILAFYYPGTKRAELRGKVRVQISANSPKTLTVSPRSGLKVRDHGASKTWTLPVGKAKRWRLKLDGKRRTVVQLRDANGWRTWRTLKGQASFRAAGKPITLWMPSGATGYRGQLHFVGPASSRTRYAVNVVGINNYIRGVVPREMPATWSPNAVRAQAVAARTYAAYEMQHPRSAYFQLCDTVSCQVYGGVASEHPASNAAVDATRGVVLHHGGKPAFTQFSSSSGGWTVANQFSYLKAQEDPYDGWAGNPVHDWKVSTTRAKIEAVWPSIGTLQRVSVTVRDGNGQWNGRARTVVLVGSKAKVTMTGDDFRYRMGLRSTWFTFKAS